MYKLTGWIARWKSEKGKCVLVVTLGSSSYVSILSEHSLISFCRNRRIWYDICMSSHVTRLNGLVLYSYCYIFIVNKAAELREVRAANVLLPFPLAHDFFSCIFKTISCLLLVLRATSIVIKISPKFSRFYYVCYTRMCLDYICDRSIILQKTKQ